VRVDGFERIESPASTGRVRLLARITYEDPEAPAEELWFEVLGDCAPAGPPSGEPWLVALAPLAALLGEPLHITAPVDPRLLGGLRELLHLWRSWDARCQVVPLGCREPRPSAAAEGERARGRGAFFSGGVDSFFTVVRASDPEARGAAAPLDGLVAVHGFDVPLANGEASRRMQASLGDAAGSLGWTSSRSPPTCARPGLVRFRGAGWSSALRSSQWVTRWRAASGSCAWRRASNSPS